MKGIDITIEHKSASIIIRKEFFEKPAIEAAAYKLTDNFVVGITPEGDMGVAVTIKAKFDSSDSILKEASETFCNEIIDQQVRLDLERRYGNIRNLIVKQAFAPIANIREEIKTRR